jgi:Fe-S-cluster containining protein
VWTLPGFSSESKIRSEGRLSTDDGNVGGLPRAVDAARARPEAMAAVARLYRELADAVAERKPVCTASGRCCRFEAYGHRMYVSTIELARFVADLDAAGELPANAEWDGMGCPFQIDGLCSVHAVRPLGCRTFYCDPSSTEWQNEMYERHHAELRALHDEIGVPYQYTEWRVALRELGWEARTEYQGARLTVRGRPLHR